MSVSLYEGRRYDPHLLLRTMSWVNFAIAGSVVFAWRYVGPFIADAISAASKASVSPTGRPELLEYPYSLMWILPLVAVVIAWMSDTFGYKTFAKFSILYPTLLFGSAIAWHHYFIYIS